MPRNPGGSPLCLRHPIPANARAEIPAAIVIGSPRPGLVAGPVPAGFSPLPVSVAIGPPIGFDPGRNPAPSIRAHNLPPAVGPERLIEIILAPNLHIARAEGNIRLHGWWGHINLTRRRRLIITSRLLDIGCA